MSSICFNPLKLNARVSTKTTASRASSVVVRADANKPTADWAFGLPGSTAPLGQFDPAGFLKNKDEKEVRRLREAEITHSRVAMLASVGFPLAENFNPFFDGAIKGPALYHFQQLPPGFWVALLAVLGVSEYRRALKGWVNPSETNRQFQIKGDYMLGDLGWDPLSLKRDMSDAELATMQTKELNHGRLAMFGIAGEIAQELASGQELFNLEDDGLLNDANCTGTICDILEKSG